MTLQRRMSRLVVFTLFALFIAACGSGQSSWAGLNAIETEYAEAGEGDPEPPTLLISYEDFVARITVEGNRLWAYPDEDNRRAEFFAAASFEDGIVYLGDYSGGVHAVDLETGDRIWAREQSGTELFGLFSIGGSTDRVIGEVAIGEDLIYVPDENGIIAIEKETGDLVEDWELETERAVWSQPLYLPATDASPERLFVNALDKFIYSVDPQTGETRWKTNLEGAAAGAPAYDAERNLLFVGTFSEEVVAINAETGDILDRYEAEGWVWDQPAFADGMLYFGDLGGYVHVLAFTVEDGEAPNIIAGQFEEVWSRRVEEAKVRAQPLVTDDLVIVGTSEGSVFGLDRDDGEQEWRTETDNELLSRFILTEFEDDGETFPVILTATDDNENLVVRLRLDNGNRIGSSYDHRD